MKNFFLAIMFVFTLTVQANIHDDFESRKKELNAPWIYEVFNTPLTPEERNAMEYLYAYLPLPDLTDYDPNFLLDNVRQAIKVREEMSWQIPDREWLFFVLPLRVNNEDLDEHRTIFYEELKDRVKGLPMEEAVLEVNHWCHEKVTYQPSDSRTHSPLASVSSGIGRCGEESTFTVAALRSVGIPARQIYTPRWAHTDDNHAWVEAWVDGKWHFLGACEPEAVLDLGWFNAPAARGMLMNTRAIGQYTGPEEKLLEMPTYTDINVTENYAPVDTLYVKVTNEKGEAQPNAKVDFCVYNYAEFYPVATKYTDSEGNASIVTGLGDLIVWVSKNDKFDISKHSVGKDRNATIILDSTKRPSAIQEFDIVPPNGKPNIPEVSPEKADMNAKLLAMEDSIHNAYVSTFVSKARGNQNTIDAFRAFCTDNRCEGVLNGISDKDWTDVSLEVLKDALNAPVFTDSALYYSKVLPVRIANEFLNPIRNEFLNIIPSDLQEQFRANPLLWAQWIADNIALDQSWQPTSLRMSPLSVMRLRKTDKKSRDICLIAGGRAMGIPCRIDETTGKAQYYDQDGQPHDYWSELTTGKSQNPGMLNLKYDKEGHVENPGYYTHFTISKIEDGQPKLQNYPEDCTWEGCFQNTIDMDPGDYMLISGQRMADGSVLAQVNLFEIKPEELTEVELVIPQNNDEINVIGHFNSEDKYYDNATQSEKSVLSTTGRGYYVLALMANGQEPSNHAIRDLEAVSRELEKAGRPILLLYPTQEDVVIAQQKNNSLPDSLISYGVDTNGSIREELVANLNLENISLPIVIIADTFNRVVFVSEGYTIGLGQQLVQMLNKLND